MTATTAPPQDQSSPLRIALAGLIGNVLEWFDFAVFGYFSASIGAAFFPQSDPSVGQLLAYGTFAIGFFARPVGSIVLGRFGDRVGRKALLTLSIVLMGTSTLAMGLLPTYAQVGLLAPVILLVMRLVQGFSLGGEFTGSMVFTTEGAVPRLRGLVSSATAAGATIGFILGSGTAGLINAVLSPEQVDAFGWRLPMIASAVLVAAGLLLRRGLHETEAGLKAVEQAPPPLWRSLMADWRPIVQTFGIIAFTNAAYYLTFTFVVDLRGGEPGAHASQFLLANTIALCVTLGCKPLGGWISDRIGRRRLMLILTIVMMIIIVPAFLAMLYGSLPGFIAGQVMVAIPVGLALGMQGAMLVEIFPLRSRVLSLSVAYSLTLALSGGVAPFISQWLITTTGLMALPAVVILGYAVVGLIVLIPLGETNSRSLR